MAESKDQILERLLSDIDDKYDKTVGSFMYDTQKPRAIEDEKIYARIEKIADRAFVKTATGDDLKEKLREVAIEMKTATYSKGKVTITGNPDDVVSAGTKVMSDKLFFTITSKGIIGETGTVEVTAICDTPGSIGNVPAGAIKAFPTSVGFSAVINNEPFAGGYDAETEDEAKGTMHSQRNHRQAETNTTTKRGRWKSAVSEQQSASRDGTVRERSRF